jgi:hypothetical protein
MKLFISWSGERSRALAQALHDWIPLVLHYVEPWLSEADIGAGERWADAVAKELESSNFGIICITRENVNSPWILFEAGALAKSMQGSRVIPLLLDLEFRDITGPLAQFQAKKFEKSGLCEVIISLNQVSNNQVLETRANQLFEALWPKFEETITKIPEQTGIVKHTRSQHEILEELVASVRALDSRFREISEGEPRISRNRRYRFHPVMIRELSGMMSEKPGDPVGLLILASIFRDELPWVYELAMEAYHSMKRGQPEDAKNVMRLLKRMEELFRNGPFPFETFGIDPTSIHLLIRELMHWNLFDQDDDIGQPKVKSKKIKKFSGPTGAKIS